MAAERRHQAGADVVGLPGGGQAAHLAKIFLRPGWMAGDVGQRLILDDAATGKILVLRLDLAPCCERLEAA